MKRLSDHMIKLILLAISSGAIFWILDSAFMAYILHESRFTTQLFAPTTHEIWRRIVVFVILLGFTFFLDLILTKQKVSNNIHDLKIENKTSETNQSFHQSIIDGVAVPIMVIGFDYQIKLMNKAAREFSSKDTQAATSLKCFQISHQSETPCSGVEHPCPLNLVRGSEQHIRVVHKHYQADGNFRNVEVIVSPLLDTFGNIQGIIESMYDITERQRAEETKEQYTNHLRALTTQLTEVADVERSRLARELHDQVGQNLTAIGINLNIIRSYIPEGTSTPVLFHLMDSQTLVEKTTEQIRDLMADLRPPLLDEYGLITALRWYGDQFSRRTHISITIEGNESTPRLTTRFENVLFNIAQEALTNVAKHAQATSASVTLEVNSDLVRMVVSDNGIGFYPVLQTKPDGNKGWGLVTMTERAESVGGRCRIESYPNQGTRVIVELIQ